MITKQIQLLDTMMVVLGDSVDFAAMLALVAGGESGQWTDAARTAWRGRSSGIFSGYNAPASIFLGMSGVVFADL